MAATARQARVRAAIIRLNNLYGRGDGETTHAEDCAWHRAQRVETADAGTAPAEE